jgi:acetylornithine deacetylase
VSELPELLRQLVAIESVNPALANDATGEGAIARHVAAWLERAGLDVELDEVVPGRPNVVARARGSGGGRTLLLNAHTDTVGVAAMEDGFEPRREGDRLYGRGAYDMKGGLAAIMLAAAEASRLSLAGDVVVAAVIDEELASLGTERLVATVRADAAIVTEPTELEVVVAHKGFAGFEIETRGRAAHGSRPDLGVDAIAKMGGVLVAIERLDGELRAAGPSHPLVGTGSVHASLIEGGQEYSSYPERCALVGERRLVPGETPAHAEGELRTILEGLASADPQLDAALTMGFARPPLELPEGEPFVETVRRVAEAVLGAPPALAGRPFWTDAAILAEAGIPTVLLGPGGDGAHAAVEWVDLDDCERLVEILVGVAREVCG